jgi:hypothetical protein
MDSLFEPSTNSKALDDEDWGQLIADHSLRVYSCTKERYLKPSSIYAGRTFGHLTLSVGNLLKSMSRLIPTGISTGPPRASETLNIWLGLSRYQNGLRTVELWNAFLVTCVQSQPWATLYFGTRCTFLFKLCFNYELKRKDPMYGRTTYIRPNKRLLILDEQIFTDQK